MTPLRYLEGMKGVVVRDDENKWVRFHGVSITPLDGFRLRPIWVWG